MRSLMRMGQPQGVGPFVFHVKHRLLGDGVRYSAMKSSRSRTIAAFGFAPTIVLATSPLW